MRKAGRGAALRSSVLLGAAVIVAWSSSGCGSSSGRDASQPDRRPIGCTRPKGELVLHGPRHGRRVALTFDDGPSWYFTPKMLRILHRYRVPATFFDVGKHVQLRPGIVRKTEQLGNELGNHSYTHPHFPGYRQIARTNAEIRRTTGFTPCLFRAPFGQVNRKVRAGARRAHLTIVGWDTDSGDGAPTEPSAGVIRHKVLAYTRPGSIVLFEDGGQKRQRTTAALPAIIRGLRARGFRFVTLTDLLGGRILYGR